MRLYGETSPFSQEARNYGFHGVEHRVLPLEDAPNKIKGLRSEITRQVAGLTENEVLAIAFAGFPGVGKTSQLRHMVSTAAKALGGGASPLLLSHHPTPGVDATPIGRIARDGRVGVIHGDNMFRAIGSDRRGVMISDTENFRHHWGDDEKLARIFWNIVMGVEPDDKVYRGSGDEKKERMPLGTLELLSGAKRGQKNVMIIEGVQSIDALERIEAMRGKYRLKTMKILFDVSIGDSLIRLLRRDRNQKIHPDGSPYTFEEILEHRLIEQYYILESFIGPAYQDDSVILLDKPREMPPFREFEIEAVLTFFETYRPKPPHSHNAELMWFVADLSGFLKRYFTALVPVSESEYEQWKVYRNEKKRAQELTT